MRSDVKDKLLTSGVESVDGTPQALAATMQKETAELTRLIRSGAIKVD
jgi:hypothetical protein